MIVARSCIPDPASVAAHYDDLDPFYRSVWGEHLHHGYWISGKEAAEQAVLNLTHLVAQRAGIRSGTSVCDIGCGYGATALILARDYGATVTGITISHRQFAIAQSAAKETANARFMLADAMDNGLQGGSFDSVIAIESSEHMPDKRQFFSEALRLLRPEGRLLITSWLTRESPNFAETKFLLEPICTEGRLPSLASATEYQEMLAAAGFREVSCADLTTGVQKTWSLCAVRFITKSITDPAFRRGWRNPALSNRIFAKTIFRIWLAYKIGSVRYGLFSAVK
ncbi:MAG TPA: class I SAM-dependent methyltransferase [Candidatus Binatia bacterium]|nr:class I SAM-dependent methyltransferase [Candidatus Binatia bacterium]